MNVRFPSAVAILQITAALSLLYLFNGVAAQKKAADKETEVACWLTDPARSVLFQQQQPIAFTKGATTDLSITINEREQYQSIDGFGFALTGGSAAHIKGMSAPARAALLQELFSTRGNSIGASYLRVSIGASDLNDHVFSYDDLPPGETDPGMKRFDLGPDRNDVIPVLKEILAINPHIQIMGSPWSPPVWMKTNGDTSGGSLKPEWYDAYALYFVTYIRQMQREGITIDAITVQNEPLHPGNNPSLLMPAGEQALFIKESLGPAFRKAGLSTKIIIYDHNADKPEYPLAILQDREAAQYINGSAFHLYGGKIEALSSVHEAYPGKQLYFTEQWVGGPGNFKKDIADHIEKLVIGATRNWCRTVIEWNLASDPLYQPHTDRGGCDRCLGAVTIAGDSVTRNPAYYIIAHAAKFVRPGSVRIASAGDEQLANVSFKTPEGKTVLILLNRSAANKTFSAGSNGHWFRTTLAGGATATYVW